jgi:hypothetical protein
VSGIDGTSRNNKRPCGVADSFQVRKHVVEFHRDDSRNVFAKHPSGSRFANNAEHLWPDRTVICRASSLPGNAERLARKSACDEGDTSELGSVEIEDVAKESRTAWTIEVPYLRPVVRLMFFPSVVSRCDGCETGVGQKVFGEHFLAVPVDLAEPDCPESCPLRCKCEAADAAKEVEVRRL